MDEKKVREAIDIISNFTILNIDEFYLDCEDMEELVNTLTIALEKRLPKKVDAKEEYKTFDEDFMYFKGFCPDCGFIVDSSRNRYCPSCGQKLDWSE